MTLIEMAVEYRISARALRERIDRVRCLRSVARTREERVLLDERIKVLETMWRETRDIAVVMERYYDRGYRHNAKYTV
ncbi:MAG: hypothetical protein RRY65_02605 [Pseudoflavonifractor sp.]